MGRGSGALRPLVVLAVCCAVMALAGSAAAATLSGRAAGGRIAAEGSSIRAVNVLTGQVADAARLRPGGRFALRVPAGPYSVLTTVPAGAGVRRSISPVVWLRRAGSRARVPVSLRRTRPVRPRPARRTAIVSGVPPARALQGGPAPVVAVKRFLTGGADPSIGAALADLVQGDLVDAGSGACRPRVVEWERRADVQRERDFWRSGYVDRSSVPRGAPLRPRVFVEGVATRNPDGSGTYEVQLVDAATGRTLGGDHGSVGAGGDWSALSGPIAGRLSEQLCGGTYDLTLNITTDASFATHATTANITSTITTTPTRLDGPGIGTSFFGEGTLGYRGSTFTSFLPGCAYTAISPIDTTWGVSLDVTDLGRLRVTWLPGTGGPRVTASIACPDAPPIAGQPGASLIGVEPLQFEVPVAGGSVDVTGGFRDGGDGWTHRGVMVLRRIPG
jgi:hypothetical protein